MAVAVVDDPAQPAGRAGGRLRVRRPGGLRGPARRRWVPRVDRVSGTGQLYGTPTLDAPDRPRRRPRDRGATAPGRSSAATRRRDGPDRGALAGTSRRRRLRGRGDDEASVQRPARGRGRRRGGRAASWPTTWWSTTTSTGPRTRSPVYCGALQSAVRAARPPHPSHGEPLPMADRHPTMMDPPVEDLLDRVDSKFTLVSLAAKRGRQINSYFNQLGEGSRHHRAAAGHLGLPQAPLDRPGGDRRRQDHLHPAPTRRAEAATSDEAEPDGRRPAAIGDRRASSPGRAGRDRARGRPAASPPTRPSRCCRRLVDAGAHVEPGHDARAPPASSGPSTFSALASEPVRTSLVGRARSRSRTPGWARPPT